MKTNRPTRMVKNQTEALIWYDLGYEDAVLDHDFTDTAYDTGWDKGRIEARDEMQQKYDKGWMEARDDMEGVLEIVHFCLKNDRALFAQLIIENYINTNFSIDCKENNDE